MAKYLFDLLYPWIGGLIAGGLSAFLLLPSKFFEGQMKLRFDRYLEQFKSDQSKAVERLKEQLSHLSDRGKRSNELEFAAIRSIWEHVIDAHHAVDGTIVNFWRSPDLSLVSDEELALFLEGQEFSPAQIKQVKESGDRNTLAPKIGQFRRIATAGELIFNAHRVIRKERIVVPEDLRTEFLKVLDMIAAAYVRQKMTFERSIPFSEKDPVSHFLEEGPRLIDKLANSVRNRLLRLEAA